MLDEPDVALRHALNNLFGKIIGAAELALDGAVSPKLRAELDTIIRLAEEGGELAATIGGGERLI